MELTKTQQAALKDSHGTVKSYFIIAQDPNCVPDKKRPPVQTADGAEQMLLELVHYRPKARLTLVRLTWDDDLWLDDGHCVLAERAFLGDVPLKAGGVAKLRMSDRGISLWARAADQKVDRKVAGPFSTSREAIPVLAALSLGLRAVSA